MDGVPGLCSHTLCREGFECTGDMLYKTDWGNGLHHGGEQLVFRVLA
jgi:hypothetical protein